MCVCVAKAALRRLNVRCAFGVKRARRELPGGTPSSPGSNTQAASYTGASWGVEKVKGHSTIVLSYINVSVDLRQEPGPCSWASGGQIGADRQTWPRWQGRLPPLLLLLLQGCCFSRLSVILLLTLCVCLVSLFFSAPPTILFPPRCSLPYSAPSYVPLYISWSCTLSAGCFQWS